MRKAHYRLALRRLAVAPGSTHLDVGASYGWMVEVGLELGLDSFGIEPGEAPVRREIAERIERATLDEYVAHSGRRFDLITIWHALEHFSDPAKAVAALRELLAKDGRLVVAVPNAEGWMYRLAYALEKGFGSHRLMSEVWYLHNPNMHHSYFSPSALKALLARGGLQIEDLVTMEAFDWRSIHRRVERPLPRTLLRLAGPFVAASGFTRRENLVVWARR